MKHPNFVGIGDRNIENDFIPLRQALWPFGPQDHPRHVQQIWGANKKKLGGG